MKRILVAFAVLGLAGCEMPRIEHYPAVVTEAECESYHQVSDSTVTNAANGAGIGYLVGKGTGLNRTAGAIAGGALGASTGVSTAEPYYKCRVYVESPETGGHLFFKNTSYPFKVGDKVMLRVQSNHPQDIPYLVR